MNRNKSTNNINASYFDNKKIAEVINEEDLKNYMNNNNIIKDEDEGKTNFYANFLEKPKKINRVGSLVLPKNINIVSSSKRGKIKLPSLIKK